MASADLTSEDIAAETLPRPSSDVVGDSSPIDRLPVGSGKRRPGRPRKYPPPEVATGVAAGQPAGRLDFPPAPVAAAGSLQPPQGVPDVIVDTPPTIADYQRRGIG